MWAMGLWSISAIQNLRLVLGREFASEMTTALVSEGELEPRSGLAKRGSPSRPQYMLKHVLVQDAAYSSVLRRIQSVSPNFHASPRVPSPTSFL